MTDIVERLRDASYANAPSRCMEAAGEIERLRHREVALDEALRLAREWMEALTKSYSKKYGQTEYESAVARIEAVIWPNGKKAPALSSQNGATHD